MLRWPDVHKAEVVVLRRSPAGRRCTEVRRLGTTTRGADDTGGVAQEPQGYVHVAMEVTGSESETGVGKIPGSRFHADPANAQTREMCRARVARRMTRPRYRRSVGARPHCVEFRAAELIREAGGRARMRRQAVGEALVTSIASRRSWRTPTSSFRRFSHPMGVKRVGRRRRMGRWRNRCRQDCRARQRGWNVGAVR